MANGFHISYLKALGARNRPMNFLVPVGEGLSASPTLELSVRLAQQSDVYPLDQSTIAWSVICNNMVAPSKNVMVGVRERGKRAGQRGWADHTIDVHHEVVSALREVPVRVVGYQGRKTELLAVEIM